MPGQSPTISPTSPIGEVYRYRLVGPPGYSVLDLKTLQDWVLQRRFRAVPGVIDVTGWGGKTKTYELQVDFNKLVAYGLTLPQIAAKARRKCRKTKISLIIIDYLQLINGSVYRGHNRTQEITEVTIGCHFRDPRCPAPARCPSAAAPPRAPWCAAPRRASQSAAGCRGCTGRASA